MVGGTKRRNPKRSKTMTSNESQSEPVAHWTKEDKKTLKVISPLLSFPTHFANREILKKMGLLETIDEFFTKMGLGAFTSMDHATFSEPTNYFFSTMVYTFKNPKTPLAKEGIINFKVKTKAFSISILDLCEAYGFENKSEMSFPKFKGIHFLWGKLASGKFSCNASIKSVRNLVIRYTLKLLAHALFGGGETSSTTVSEMCFLFQGVKELLVEDADGNGDERIVYDDLGNDVNYGW
uniref:Arabidopsis retrotransposon Orf1 C-terminal domain-containing protein n=2 Tax=Arabidopsis thaliana TaxID=3702 RepID=Q1PDS2_ARATH|nr:hypothetical protein At5g28623 [Arabidopsis thaliana]